MKYPVTVPWSRRFVPELCSPPSSVIVYDAFLVHQDVGCVTVASTSVLALGSRFPKFIVPPETNLQVPVTVADTATLVWAAVPDPAQVARRTAVIRTIVLFMPDPQGSIESIRPLLFLLPGLTKGGITKRIARAYVLL